MAQPKLVAGTYKISSLKIDNNITLSKANVDSIVRVTIETAFAENQKNAGVPLTKEDSLQIINDKKKFFEGIMTLTLQLKADGKFVKTMKQRFGNKMEIIESGTYKYNAKNGEIKLKSRETDENEEKQAVQYDRKTKRVNFIAGPNEADAGETIVQFVNTKKFKK